MTTTYERLDEHEVDSVRAYRRSLWLERADRDPAGARAQVIGALSEHADEWVNGISIVTLASVAMRGVTIGDLTDTQRYSLITVLHGAAR